jgi:hypothetical protein
MKFWRRLSLDREKVAFFITLITAAGFVVVGMFTGTDEVYGIATSSTVTTTITATINAVIVIDATNTVDLGSFIPGNSTPADGTGYVSVVSNSAQGYKLYNYMDNYMTRTATPYASIQNTPVGPASAPTPWTLNTDFGLGFSLSGPTNDAKWHNGAGAYNYASFTTTSAAAQLVNNYTTWSNQTEYLSVVYVLDAGSAQASGAYEGFVNWFAITNV